MWIQADNYADFKLIANGFGVTPAVFYHDGGSSFQCTAVANVTVGIRLSLGSAKPGSFNSDYPSAVSLSADAFFG